MEKFYVSPEIYQSALEYPECRFESGKYYIGAIELVLRKELTGKQFIKCDPELLNPFKKQEPDFKPLKDH